MGSAAPDTSCSIPTKTTPTLCNLKSIERTQIWTLRNPNHKIQPTLRIKKKRTQFASFRVDTFSSSSSSSSARLGTKKKNNPDLRPNSKTQSLGYQIKKRQRGQNGEFRPAITCVGCGSLNWARKKGHPQRQIQPHRTIYALELGGMGSARVTREKQEERERRRR